MSRLRRSPQTSVALQALMSPEQYNVLCDFFQKDVKHSINEIFSIHNTPLHFEGRKNLLWKNFRIALTQESEHYPEEVKNIILKFRNNLLRVVNKTKEPTMEEHQREAYLFYVQALEKLEIQPPEGIPTPVPIQKPTRKTTSPKKRIQNINLRTRFQPRSSPISLPIDSRGIQKPSQDITPLPPVE